MSTLLRFLGLVVVCALISACNKPTSFTPQLTAEEVRAEEIAQQNMVDALKARGGKPKSWKNHPNMRGQFEDVGERIEKAGAQICVELHLQERGCYYYFEMNRDNKLNAHADGKNIVIYTGMMRFVESDDELAAVMAHEFAHNLMGHVQAEKMNGMVGMFVGAAVDALASTQGINTQGGMMQTGAEIAILNYSEAFEQEADYVGLYIMARAGYDISRAPMFWRRMSLENPQEIYITTTHPSNAFRFVALQKAVFEINYKRKHKIALLPDFKNNQ